jgi:hypothetical protein
VDRQIGQPGVIGTRQTLGPHPGFSFHAGQDHVPVGGVANRGGGEHVQLFHPEPAGRIQGAFDGGDHPVHPGNVDGSVSVERLAEQRRLLDSKSWQRRRAGTHLDHLQLSRVRPNVQNT